MDYHITVQGEQKGPYSLSQIQSMWESGAINDDSRYWDSESEEWKPIKELIEPKPPVLEEQPESGEEDWHVSNIDFPVADNPAPPVLKDSTPPKSKSTLTLISQIAFVIAGMALIIFLLPKIEFWRLASEARESAALAPTDGEIEEDKKLSDSIVGTWKPLDSSTSLTFRTNGAAEFYGAGTLIAGKLTWELVGEEIHVKGENGAIIIFRVLTRPSTGNPGTIQSYAAIDASGKRSSSIGSPLMKTK